MAKPPVWIKRADAAKLSKRDSHNNTPDISPKFAALSLDKRGSQVIMEISAMGLEEEVAELEEWRDADGRDDTQEMWVTDRGCLDHFVKTAVDGGGQRPTQQWVQQEQTMVSTGHYWCLSFQMPVKEPQEKTVTNNLQKPKCS